MDKSRGFLILRLANTDFEFGLGLFVEEISSYRDKYFKMTTEDIKNKAIQVIVAGNILHSANSTASLSIDSIVHVKEYLENALTVSFSDEWVELDHDGGSMIYSYWQSQGFLV